MRHAGHAWGGKKCVQNLSGNLTGRDRLGDLGIGGLDNVK